MDREHPRFSWPTLKSTLSSSGSRQAGGLVVRAKTGNIALAMCLLLLTVISTNTYAIINGGPNDFYDPDPWTQTYVRSVEKHHLDPAKEQVIKGFTTSSTGAKWRNIWEEIDFILRWFPNHPAGLQFMARWLPKYSHPPDKDIIYYFEKAIEYQPSPVLRPVDATARMLYAIYFHKNNEHQRALELYESALSIAPENPEIHYNIGLLLFTMKDYPRSLKHGQKAYALGFPLPGLRNKLIKAGIWDENEKNNNK